MDTRTGHSFLTTTVYGPQGETMKHMFIQEMRHLYRPHSTPWFLGGDFNLVRWLTDRANAAPEWQLMDEFNDLIRQLQLYDVPLQDRRFTWPNRHPNPSFSRIDRVFLGPSMLTAFQRVVLQPGSMLLSDHIPQILICSQQASLGCINRLEKHWMKYEDFSNISKEVFAQVPQHNVGDSTKAFSAMVHTLHARLRTLQKCKFSNASTYLHNCKKIIAFFDGLEECRILIPLENFIRIKVKEKAYKFALNDELKWHHRSR